LGPGNKEDEGGYEKKFERTKNSSPEREESPEKGA